MADTPEAQRVKAIAAGVRTVRDAHAAALVPTSDLPQFSTREDGVVIGSRGQVIYTPPVLPPLGKKKES